MRDRLEVTNEDNRYFVRHRVTRAMITGDLQSKQEAEAAIDRIIKRINDLENGSCAPDTD